MALTMSKPIPLGTPAPPFRLRDTHGDDVSLDDLDGDALVVVFMCNHCPYVKHVKAKLAEIAATLLAEGAAVVAINANDWTTYPEDAPDRMADDVRRFRYPFPYLLDAQQDVAAAYGAACTPDFFVFDADRRLAYHGQFDDSRPGSGQATGADLVAAVRAVLRGEPVPAGQKPSMGCGIKWRAGREPR